MKFNSFFTACAAMALLATEAEANYKPSRWATQRINDVKQRLERTYGKGLVGMKDPETGKVDPRRFGWDNRKLNGAPMGSSISVTIPGTSLVVDASTQSAFALGFATGMKYDGMDQSGADGSAGQDVTLTNCFAATYSMIQTLENMAYNYQTIADTPGSFNWFDVFAIDPIHVVGDSTVLYEMCDGYRYLDQFTSLASLDYAFIGKSLTREVMFMAMESPEMFDQINKLAEAGQCAQKVYADGEEEENTEELQEEEAEVWNFNTEADSDASTDDDSQLGEAYECFDLVDRYTMGIIGGRIWTRFWDTALQPNV